MPQHLALLLRNEQHSGHSIGRHAGSAVPAKKSLQLAHLVAGIPQFQSSAQRGREATRNRPSPSLHSRYGSEGLITGEDFVAPQTTEGHFEAGPSGFAGDHESINAINAGLDHGTKSVRNGLDHARLGDNNF